MDLRVEKTRKNIINAFIELRSKKALEKITVRELCELTQINKSTFYAHYQDIFALSDSIEADLVSNIVKGLSRPEAIFERPDVFTRELIMACVAQRNLIRIIFSGNQEGHLSRRLETSIKEFIFQTYPDCRADAEKNIFLSYCIYGGFHAYQQNLSYGLETVIQTLGCLNQKTKEAFLNKNPA